MLLKIWAIFVKQKNSNSKIISNHRDDDAIFKNCNIKLNAIPSGQHSNGKINISKINGIHSQLETWLSKFRGVSIRHLQEYLDWFVFIFTMKKKFSLNKVKTESYNTVVLDNNYIKSHDIFKKVLPIDLNIAYSEYLHQS